jgi:hypothetical protein
LGQQGKVVTPKIPGWGLASAMIIETRKAPNGQTQACVLPPEHEAPFWVDLREVGRFGGRFIYDGEAPLSEAPDVDSRDNSD